MAATYLDPLTDLYSHKKKVGPLLAAISKAKPDNGIADMEGFAEGGGIIPSIIDWTNRNIVQPATGVIQNIMPHPTVAPAPALQPSQVGSGYLNQSGIAAQTHNQAVQRVANDVGYAEGGAVDDDPLKRASWPTIPPQVTTQGIASTPPANQSNYQFIPTQQQPVVNTAPHGASGSWDIASPSPIAEPPMPITTTTTPSIDKMPVAKVSDPLTEVAPITSNFAQVGKKRIGIDDIGVEGKDPLAAKGGSLNVISNEQFQNSGLAADPNYGKAGYTKFNTITKQWEKPEPQILVGNPQGISSYMPASEAFAKGLMSPQQSDAYQKQQIAEREATLAGQLTGSEIKAKTAEAGLATAKAKALEGGGPMKKGGMTPNGQQVFYDGKGHQFVQSDDGQMEPYSGKVTSGSGFGRMYQMLNKETGQIEQVSQQEKEANPDKYGAGASDPNVKAWANNEKYHTANANFVNTIDAFGKQAADIMQKYGLNQDPKLLNYPIQQLIKLKGMGAGDVAALNNLLTGFRGEMSKMAEGSLGVAGAHVETARKYYQTVSDSMPLKDFLTMSDWASKEGQARLGSIQMESDRLKKQLGIKAVVAAPSGEIDKSKPVHNGKIQGYKQADGTIVDETGKRLN